MSELNHITITPRKEAMMHGLEELLPEAFELVFQAANIIIKCAFFRFLEWLLPV